MFAFEIEIYQRNGKKNSVKQWISRSIFSLGFFDFYLKLQYSSSCNSNIIFTINFLYYYDFSANVIAFQMTELWSKWKWWKIVAAEVNLQPHSHSPLLSISWESIRKGNMAQLSPWTLLWLQIKISTRVHGIWFWWRHLSMMTQMRLLLSLDELCKWKVLTAS